MVDKTKWTISSLAAFLDMQRTADRERVGILYEADHTAFHTALETIDKRLDRMNEFRQALSDAVTRNITRAEFDAIIGPMREKQLSIGKPNWLVVVGMGSLIVGFMSSVWLILGLQISVAVGPQVLALEQLKAAQVAHTNNQTELLAQVRTLDVRVAQNGTLDATNTAERSQLAARLTKLEDAVNLEVSERKAGDARNVSRVTEINGKVCAINSMYNLMHATDLRAISLLWSATHKGEVLPTNNVYYPEFCNK